MYRSILVPLDGSPFGEQALPMALGIAKRAGATLQVAHVYVPLALLYAEARPNVENTQDPRVLEQARNYLDGVVQRLKPVSKIPVTSVFLQGPIAQTLQEHAQAAGVDLIVMSTHGRGALRRFWLGSVADELLRRSTVPLLLIRPREEAVNFDKEPALNHILIPLDGSELAERVLEPATALGGLMQAHYTLFRVVPTVQYVGYGFDYYPVRVGDENLDQLHEATAQAYLDRVAGRLRKQSLPVESRVLAEPQAATAILDEARILKVDLIALATHGRRGMARLLLGSVADKVIRGATAPVLVVRPPSA
jgi:nucleotide-binding universal stress UspA family protein